MMTMWFHARRELHTLGIQRQAREWLRHNDPALVACQAMFRLNRYAMLLRRKSAERDRLYEMKNQMVRLLFDQGRCAACSTDIQELSCRHCQAGISHWWDSPWGDDWDEAEHDPHGHSCEWCNGTGVYKTITLYRFVFDVDGRRFVWHQPSALVSWPVNVDASQSREYADRPRDLARDDLTDDHRRVLSLAVHLFLSEYGRWKWPAEHTLLHVARAAWDDVAAVARDQYYAVRLFVQWRRLDWRRRIEKVARKKARRPRPYEQIPF
jgi:hypothetical protein